MQRPTMMKLLHDYWARWHTYHRVRSTLSQRSDAELADLRVARGDIERVAWQTAFGRAAATGRAPLGG
jgi:uncharacterized protein YjiS (DUF1127 family)